MSVSKALKPWPLPLTHTHKHMCTYMQLHLHSSCTYSDQWSWAREWS